MNKSQWAVLLKAHRLANEHSKQAIMADEVMESLGYDVSRLRDEDACGYVDMVDYGTGLLALTDPHLETFKVHSTQKDKDKGESE